MQNVLHHFLQYIFASNNRVIAMRILITPGQIVPKILVQCNIHVGRGSCPIKRFYFNFSDRCVRVRLVFDRSCNKWP